MRKVMAAALLAATVLAPMAAEAQDGEHRGGWRGRDGGGQQNARPQAQGQPVPQAQPQPQPQPQARLGGGGYAGRNRYDGGQGGRGGYQGQAQVQVQPGVQGHLGADQRPGEYGGQRGAQPGGFRAPGSNGGRQFVQPGRQGGTELQARGEAARFNDDRARRVDGGYRRQLGYAGRGGYPAGGYRGYQGGYGNPGFNAGRRDFARDQRRFEGRSDWNRGWRNDARYNYNSYRQSHYDLFRLPRYEAPYGYGFGYRRFGIGATLSDIFFAEDYWIDDPYDYRLPPAYGPYRWVRYYGDALLVDVETGEVVDSVYGIFG